GLGAAADPKAYSAAMRDDDALVLTEAAWSAVWARVPGILALARKYADAPEPDPAHLELYRLLAVLRTREDRERVERLAGITNLGPPAHRLELLGLFGHPAHIEQLIGLMRDDDPETAV